MCDTKSSSVVMPRDPLTSSLPYGRFAQMVSFIKAKISKRGDLSYVSVQKQLEYVDCLSKFPLGRHLLEAGCFSSFWTDYLMPRPADDNVHCTRRTFSSFIEKFILNYSPFVNGWRESFKLFQELTQAKLKNDMTLASIPCGAMRDVLSLDYSNILDFTLIGVDIDQSVISLAEELALTTKFAQNIKFMQGDAWDLPYTEELDLITSCGLNIYEADREKALNLYHQFFQALKPGGALIIGFLTYPPGEEVSSEWNLEGVASQHVVLERVLFGDILDLKCRNFRTSREFKQELEHAGFNQVEFHYDRHRVFPTVVAYKLQ